jgi:short-subunit dehydrogenase
MRGFKIDLKGSRIAVIGASGGLGLAMCEALNREGAKITGFARNAERVAAAFAERGIAGGAESIDLGTPRAAAESLERALGAQAVPDCVVIAAGYDRRAAFSEHGEEDIELSIAVNFRSVVEICRRVAPRFAARGSGTLAYVGGFADGSLAFPYYPLDCATRAATAGLLASLNREQAPGSKVRYLYFGPIASRTAAEEPYLRLWEEMRLPIAEPEEVARALVRALRGGRRSVAMGGIVTRLGIAINVLSPELADALFMGGYRRVLARSLGPGSGSAARAKSEA